MTVKTPTPATGKAEAMTPKPPTPQGISALLKRAGFKRSERQIGGFGNGFVAEKIHGRDDAIRVRHRFWSMRANRDDALPHLAAYSVAIEAAGWAVEFGSWELIVTAKTTPGTERSAAEDRKDH